MACSPAQLEANRRNSSRSTGPQTSEGKAISRRNGLKHGLTGEGIVLPDEDVEEVDRRFATFDAEIRPRTAVAFELVKRLAVLSVRLDRSAEHEAKAISHRMRHAIAGFDEVRLAEVERLYAWIAAEPVTNSRRLRQSPEGLARLIGAMEALRADLAQVGGYRWSYDHSEQLHHLLGLRSTELPVSRVRALTDAIAGNFGHLGESEGAGLELNDRRVWAIGELVYFMDDRISTLKKQLEEFDRADLDLDRAEAPTRAIFDASPEAVLARKYEAATERALFRTLREIRAIQADATEVISEKAVKLELSEELGPDFPEVAVDISDEVDEDPTSVTLDPSAPPKRPNLEKLAKKGRKRSKST